MSGYSIMFLATYSEKTHKIKCPVTQVPTLPITVQNFLEVLLGQSPHKKDRHSKFSCAWIHVNRAGYELLLVNSRQPGRIWTIACQADSWLGALHVCAHRDLNTILINIYITIQPFFTYDVSVFKQFLSITGIAWTLLLRREMLKLNAHARYCNRHVYSWTWRIYAYILY